MLLFSVLNCFCLFVCYEDGSENFQTFYMLNQKLEFSNIWDLMCYEMFMLSYFVNEIIISLRFLAIKIVAVKDTHYTLKKPPHFFFSTRIFFYHLLYQTPLKYHLRSSGHLCLLQQQCLWAIIATKSLLCLPNTCVTCLSPHTMSPTLPADLTAVSLSTLTHAQHTNSEDLSL